MPPLLTLSIIPSTETAALFEVISTCLPYLPGLLTKELKTKYQRHHKSDDVEEEYTFIVDLSSRTQRAQ